MDVKAVMQPRAAAPSAAALLTGEGRTITARPSSVSGAPIPLGSAAPQQSPATGVGNAANVPMVTSALTGMIADMGQDDLIRQTNQQYFGGRPSGMGEVWKVIQERYAKPENSPEKDAGDVARAAGRQLDALIEQTNRLRSAVGLPDIPPLSRIMLGLYGIESQDAGNVAGEGGVSAGIEVQPQWRSDP